MKTMIVVLFTALVLLTGCGASIVRGSGRVVTQERRIGDFHSVSLAGAGDLFIVQGETETLTIEAEDNLLQYIKTEVRDGRLVISADDEPKIYIPTAPIRYNLTVRNLSAVDLSGWGNIRSASLKTDQFDIGISGAGHVVIDHLEATSLTSKQTGAGGLRLSGRVTNQTVHVSGVGDYDCADLSSQSALVEDTGPGNATVWAHEDLDVTIGGPGNVTYYGSPRVRQDRSGPGNLRSLGNKN